MPKSVLPRATQAVATGLVAKPSPGALHSFNVAAGASAGFAMVIDAAEIPANGAIKPKRVFAVAANATLEQRFDPPLQCNAGVTVVFSTTGPFTMTASATAFISACAE